MTAMDAGSGDHAYYDKSRDDVVAVIPRDARDVLDVGCAGGGLGRALKADRPGVRVRGIEPVAAQAERARAVLDAVIVGSFDEQTVIPTDWPAPDCIVFADVLEHMADPWRAVRRARAVLRPGGTLVVSLPNVVHASVTLPLLCGRFEYEEFGVLDRTHLRFFTRSSGIALIESGGFAVHEVRRNLDWHTARFDERRLHGALHRALSWERTRAPRFFAPLARVADLLTQQYLLVAR